jgi:RNA polymerase sigma-70 factor (ECF subfamily)
MKHRASSLDTGVLAKAMCSSDSCDPAAAALLHDQQARLRSAISALPHELRMVVVLRHMRDQSYQEISKALGIPISTVEHRLRSARFALRASLSDREMEQVGK